MCMEKPINKPCYDHTFDECNKYDHECNGCHNKKPREKKPVMVPIDDVIDLVTYAQNNPFDETIFNQIRRKYHVWSHLHMHYVVDVPNTICNF